MKHCCRQWINWPGNGLFGPNGILVPVLAKFRLFRIFTAWSQTGLKDTSLQPSPQSLFSIFISSVKRHWMKCTWRILVFTGFSLPLVLSVAWLFKTGSHRAITYLSKTAVASFDKCWVFWKFWPLPAFTYPAKSSLVRKSPLLLAPYFRLSLRECASCLYTNVLPGSNCLAFCMGDLFGLKGLDMSWLLGWYVFLML